MANVKYLRLGEAINYLVQVLSAVKRWNMTKTMDFLATHTHFSTDTIYDWRQGVRCPPEKSLEILLLIGKKEANLEREWGENLLKVVSYPNINKRINEIWGERRVRHIAHNLPRLEHTLFVGREAEMKRLLELLAPTHAAPLISIDGIGGVGKTALILEIAYRCLQVSQEAEINSNHPTFEAIIFISAKQEWLKGEGIVPRPQIHRTLHDIYREIASTLNRPEITHTTQEEQCGLVYRALAKQRTLLIVDNLETMMDRQEIIAFLYDLPGSVKTVITTRERAVFAPIRLNQLLEPEGILLIQHEAESKMVSLEISEADQIYHSTGGVPAAIIYVIGQLASAHSLATVLGRLKTVEGDVARFCFEMAIAALRGKPAHLLFMAIAMFPKRPLGEAVIHVAGLTRKPIVADDGFTRLKQLSLVTEQEGRYQMLPLTREYGLAELNVNPDFEKEARERWVQWYLEFTKKFGGDDWEEWYIKFNHLEEEWSNLLRVFDWCRSQDKYFEINCFWRDNANSVKSFTNIYGYWDDRVYWLSWLLEAAENRGDWATFIEISPDLGFTFSWLGHPEFVEKAKNLLARAWSLRSQTDSRTRSHIAENFAIIYILNERDYKVGYQWLEQAKKEFQEDGYSEKERIRRSIHLGYYEGVVNYEMGQYQKAKNFFDKVIALSEVINWQRGKSYAQNYLAEIAIEFGDYVEAELLLQFGLPVAERNKDKRRIAFYKFTFARLAHKRFEFAAGIYWVKQALDGFERLGMQREIDKAQHLLAELTQCVGQSNLSYEL